MKKSSISQNLVLLIKNIQESNSWKRTLMDQKRMMRRKYQTATKRWEMTGSVSLVRCLQKQVTNSGFRGTFCCMLIFACLSSRHPTCHQIGLCRSLRASLRFCTRMKIYPRGSGIRIIKWGCPSTWNRYCFITGISWIKDTVSTSEVIIQAEVLIAVTTYKCSCVYSIKTTKQIKYF